MFNKSIRSIVKNLLPIWTIKHIKAHLKSSIHFQSNYPDKMHLKNNFSNAKSLIYIADGTVQAGGLADRFRGMVSLYYLAKKFGVDYRIHFINPFPLSDAVVPNKHNWLINEDQISFSPKNSIYLNHWSGNTTPDAQAREAIETVSFFLRKYNQIHYTTNVYIADDSYGELFDELFQPSAIVKSKIEEYSKEIGDDYIAVTFRFQQLLGDFTEGNFPILSKLEQNKLISRCLHHLLKIHQEHKTKKILVTSDSKSFLARANELDFTFIIPGEIFHLDYSLKTDSEPYIKSFVDYYMLTNAKKIYLIVDGPMYKSGFPERAAIHKQVPFFAIKA